MSAGTCGYARTDSLSIGEMRRLYDACAHLEDGPDYRCNRFVENLMQTAIDFQQNAEKVVVPALEILRENFGDPTIWCWRTSWPANETRKTATENWP